MESLRADAVRRIRTILDDIAPRDVLAARAAFDALLEEIEPEAVADAVVVAAPDAVAELTMLGQHLGYLPIGGSTDQ